MAFARSQMSTVVTFDQSLDNTPANGLHPVAYDPGSGWIATAGHPLNTDPLDRLRSLENDGAAPELTGNGTISIVNYFGSGVAADLFQFGESRYWTPNTYFSPLVVAPGPDGDYGHGDPSTFDIGAPYPNDELRLGAVPTEDFTQVNDNVTNQKRVLQ